MNFIGNIPSIKDDKEQIFEKLILLFIALQVAVDLLTTISVKLTGIPISIGMIARFGFLALCAVYILLYGTKGTGIMASLLTITFTWQLVFVVFFVKGPFFTNVRYYLRAAVFPYSMLAFYNIFSKQGYGENSREMFWTFLKLLNILVFTIGITFILSIITKTGFPMYGTERFRTGTSSWFLSGNEISSSMIILLTVPLINYITQHSWFNLITLCMQVFVIASLGTKSSLFLFILLMFMVFLYASYEIILKHKQIAKSLILIAVVVLSGVCYKHIPAVKNIAWQAEVKKLITLYSSQTEGSEVHPEIAANHAAAVPEDDNSYIGSIRMLIAKEQISVSGYFYPNYFDMGHANFVTKHIVFTDNHGERFEFLVEDVYNRNIPNPKESEYSSVYAGLYGIFPSAFLRLDRAYYVSVKIQVDDIVKEYPMNYGLYISQIPYEKKISVWGNGSIWVSYNYDFDPNVQYQAENILTEDTVDASFLNIWLSGRSKRLSTFIKGINITIPKALFGTGYVANYKGGAVKGLEMDFIEIAITFGLVGFLIYFAMYIYCIIKGSWIWLKKDKLRIFTRPIPILLLMAIAISAASAFIVGHTLLTPSVSINVALLTALYYCYCRSANIGVYLDDKQETNTPKEEIDK